MANESEAVQLKFGLTLQQIMDVVSYLSPPEIIQIQQVFEQFHILQRGIQTNKYHLSDV